MMAARRQAKRKQAKEHARRAVRRPAARTLAPGRHRTAVVSPQPEPRINYSDELAIALCEHIADGMSLKEACALPGMPSRTTAYKWLAEHTSFAGLYARAREERADLIADEIVTIADTETCPQRARNRIDARKWWAAKVNPRKYGDKIFNENTNTNYVISDKPMTPEEWEAEYGAIPVNDTPSSSEIH